MREEGGEESEGGREEKKVREHGNANSGISNPLHWEKEWNVQCNNTHTSLTGTRLL